MNTLNCNILNGKKDARYCTYRLAIIIHVDAFYYVTCVYKLLRLKTFTAKNSYKYSIYIYTNVSWFTFCMTFSIKRVYI